jgi:protein-S-isoprenylcysteine O-methyltransferase Ste14
VFLGVVFLTSIVSIVPLLKNPELLTERFKPPLQRGQPLADKILLLLFIGEFCGVTLCIPLDVFRWHLLGRPGPLVSSLGLVGFVGGWAIIALALRENAFAAPVVRHQAERHQIVIDTGLYGLVRHPMYAGFVPVIIGMPLWLDSSAAALLASLPIATIAIGARVEESFLRRELPGYAVYMTRVRSRFIPFLW